MTAETANWCFSYLTQHNDRPSMRRTSEVEIEQPVREIGTGDRKVRVLHVVTRLVRRGVPRHVLDVATHLDPERFHVEVLAGQGELWEGSLWEEAREKGAVTHRVDSLRRSIHPVKDVIALWKLYRKMGRGRYDIVHTHISKAGFLGRLAARWAGVPVVVHTYHGRVEELDPGKVKGRFLTACERFAAKQSDALIAVSAAEVEQKRAVGIGSDSQYHVVRAGIDLSRYLEQQAWDRPQAVTGRPVIGTIGTLTREKGIDVLIAALPAVLDRHPGLQLCIVGEGPMEVALRRAAIRVGVDAAVHFVGAVEDVRPWLSAFDLLVQPSRSEGLALTVLEAMAMGVPVLATDVGGMSEALADGINGILVPAGDAAKLATALSELLADSSKLADMGRAGTGRIRSFSLECSVKELEALYEQLLDAASSPGVHVNGWTESPAAVRGTAQ